MTKIGKVAVLAILAFAGLPAPSALAQQQLWAAAYVDWTFESQRPGAELAQNLWVPQPSQASFFTLNWDFTAGEGGYIGLQSDAEGAGNARFSLWNATAAEGDACRRFDGEGEGMTCEIPVQIATNGIYRVRIARGPADAQGQWWTGWLQAPDGAHHRIGALRVSARLDAIAPATVHNFSEYWGDAVGQCRNVPLSAAAFAAPALAGVVGAEQIPASTPQGRRPDGHACATGRERTGAAASYRAFALEGEPAMVLTLGGAWDANRALAEALSASR